MKKLPVLSFIEITKILKKAGFAYAPKRGKGSHIAFYKKEKNKKRLVIVPKKKQIPRGTLIAILDQAGLNRDQLLEFFKK